MDVIEADRQAASSEVLEGRAAVGVRERPRGWAEDRELSVVDRDPG
jgi:hypothetical protein